MFKIIFGVLILIAFGVIEANAIHQSICASGKIEEHYSNGSIKKCVLKDSFSLNDIKCKSQNTISFYDNEQLETCVLAESAKIGGQECKESAPISFYPDGQFKSCVKND
ncbi:MAG: hypothetical protein HZC48_11205 [Nitrospirae bacterium]|nr:hypothetical protein [Nitrospirota bacterium]